MTCIVEVKFAIGRLISFEQNRLKHYFFHHFRRIFRDCARQYFLIDQLGHHGTPALRASILIYRTNHPLFFVLRNFQTISKAFFGLYHFFRPHNPQYIGILTRLSVIHISLLSQTEIEGIRQRDFFHAKTGIFSVVFKQKLAFH